MSTQEPRRADAIIEEQGQGVPAELRELRESIDNLDAAVIHIMAERFRITQRVGELKAELGLPASDPAREKRQIARMRLLAQDSRLDPEFAEKLLNFIVSEVVRHHTEIGCQN